MAAVQKLSLQSNEEKNDNGISDLKNNLSLTSESPSRILTNEGNHGETNDGENTDDHSIGNFQVDNVPSLNADESSKRLTHGFSDSFIKCPFFNIGCNNCDGDREMLDDHRNSSCRWHQELLLQSIYQAQNNTLLIQGDLRLLNEKINSLNAKVENLENQENENLDKIEQIIRDNKQKTKELKELRLEIEGLNSRLHQQTQNEDTHTFPRETMLTTPMDTNCLNLSVFEWRIEKFSKLRQEALKQEHFVVFSDPYYTHANGYKTQLFMYPNGKEDGLGKSLSINFHIIPGEYDSELVWPMMYKIVIALINQRNENPERVIQFDYHTVPNDSRDTFNRPSSQRNDGIGSDDFIDLEELSRNTNLCRNDTVIIYLSLTRTA